MDFGLRHRGAYCSPMRGAEEYPRRPEKQQCTDAHALNTIG